MSSIRKRAPAASSSTVRKVMQANVGRTTSIEAAIIDALQKHGLRFAVNTPPVPSLRWKADLVVPERCLCVFLDGCFWHACPQHFRVPKTNSAWWKEKIDANVDRDQRQTQALSQRGWRVLRFWEHQVRHELESVVDAILRPLSL